MQSNANAEAAWQELFNTCNLAELVQGTRSCGWQPVWEKLEEICQTYPFNDDAEKNTSIDFFMSYCLSYLPPENGLQLWELIDKWHHHRKLPERYGALSPQEMTAAVFFCLRLRTKLRDYLMGVSEAALGELPEQYQQLMLVLWQGLFLNMFSPLYLLDSPDPAVQSMPINAWKEAGYAGLLAASMYHPVDADDFNIDSEELFASPLPLYCKTIIMRWMIYIPYFNGTMKHRDRLVHYVPQLCQALLKHTDTVSQVYFISFVQQIMTGFWRGSYIGGNNVEALSAFGDFISASLNRFCPQLPKAVAREIKPGEKIRVGYISRNFFRQAVSLYMINRILHHDRDNFEVFVFSIGEYKDDFNEMYEKYSDHFEKFPNMQDFTAIINSVISKRLDILIFTDIGMDAVTYSLAGLRLAPIQCAMVGHGTTTGLPTIDYYISGDFEAPTAQTQYREKLIRLPNLGAAQYVPDSPAAALARRDLGVPEEAVLFISCANGIKQRPEREALYVEILRQAPNAWILLKPYTTKDGVDAKMSKRLRHLASEAGVSDRLLILPSLGHYRNVLGLLSIADVQMDTFPYGGWTTNLEALFVGLPIVTQEGELSRSRWGAGMLRALGIPEGIAADEKEYVSWAVRFARDDDLRRRLTQTIKEKALPTLFNGGAAQSAFENVLYEILGINRSAATVDQQIERDDGTKILKSIGRVTIVLPKRVCVATSIAPRNYKEQRAALQTWLDAGFEVVALNPGEEIESLRPEFPDITFAAPERDARSQFQKPYIYFDDALAYLDKTGVEVGGIINSDIHLIGDQMLGLVKRQREGAVVFGSRVDVPSLGAREGKLYNLGFDYFFFQRDVLKKFPKESFCLGLPWWDYWAAILPLQKGCQLKRLVTPVALHLSHQAAWDKDVWLALGRILAKYVPPPGELSDDTMMSYLNQLAQWINRDSRDVFL